MTLFLREQEGPNSNAKKSTEEREQKKRREKKCVCVRERAIERLMNISAQWRWDVH